MSELSADVEVHHALKLLEALIKAHGLTKKALDQKLRKGPGYISQVLTGRLELKYRHILEILGALELDPGVFFRALFAEPEPAHESGRMMESFLASLQKMGYYGERRRPAGTERGPARAVPTAGETEPAGREAAAGRRERAASGSAGAGIDPDDLDRRIRSAIREALAEGAGPAR